MFYSQIILAKKGPLGQVWQAAHWGERKLGRPAVFSTDIASITTSIANPIVPMALRVSGHLLLGIVRIYSRQVQFLLDDCHQAMIKVKMAYSHSNASTNDGTTSAGGPMIDITVTTRGTNKSSTTNAASSNHALNVSNFGEYHDLPTTMDPTSTSLRHHDHEKTTNTDYYRTTTTHFAIPLEELLHRATSIQGMEHTEEDWVPAEIDDSTLHISGNNLIGSNNTPGMTDAIHKHPRSSHLTSGTAAADEDWGVFDPNDGEGGDVPPLHDDDDDEHDPSRKSHRNDEDDGSATQHSDIEVTRAMNESAASDPLRRPSLLPMNDSAITSAVSEKDGAGGSVTDDPTDFPMVIDDIDDQNGIMFHDDDDSDMARRRRSSLRLSQSNITEPEGNTSTGIGISFDASTDDGKRDVDGATTNLTNKRRLSENNNNKLGNRRRKRRKVPTDDGHTELSNDHIRNMLADTTDICRVIGNVNIDEKDIFLHPATYVHKKHEQQHTKTNRMDDIKLQNRIMLWSSVVPQERMFCRPALGDDGGMSSDLLDLWTRNCAPVLAQPFRYDLIDATAQQQGVEASSSAATNKNVDDEENDVEQTRNERDSNRDDSTVDHSIAPDDDNHNNVLDDDIHDRASFDIDDNNNNTIPFDDEDDRIQIHDDDEQDHLVPNDSPTGQSQHSSIESIFSLGATNDMDTFGVDINDNDDPDTAASTTSKWHKNTIKVFEVLKKNLIPMSSDINEGNDIDIPSNKQHVVSYNTLSEGVSRRTAAGFFFELLQLKTLNYIEINQSESYGDIMISAGAKFTEDPPLQ